MYTKLALFVLLAVAFTSAEEAKPSAEGKPTVLSEAWDDIDNNNNHESGKKEWEIYFEKLGLKPLADKSFDEIDTNHDGNISEKEYLKWAQGK